MDGNETKIREKQLRLLNSYFVKRHNSKEWTGEKPLLQENKTTIEIQEDLEDMLHIPEDAIFDYLETHGYEMIPQTDGLVKWQIYREYF